eukprot:PhM_4_TR5286/c0_g1_i1/m.7109
MRTRRGSSRSVTPMPDAPPSGRSTPIGGNQSQAKNTTTKSQGPQKRTRETRDRDNTKTSTNKSTTNNNNKHPSHLDVFVGNLFNSAQQHVSQQSVFDPSKLPFFTSRHEELCTSIIDSARDAVATGALSISTTIHPGWISTFYEALPLTASAAVSLAKTTWFDRHDIEEAAYLLSYAHAVRYGDAISKDTLSRRFTSLQPIAIDALKQFTDQVRSSTNNTHSLLHPPRVDRKTAFAVDPTPQDVNAFVEQLLSTFESDDEKPQLVENARKEHSTWREVLGAVIEETTDLRWISIPLSHGVAVVKNGFIGDQTVFETAADCLYTSCESGLVFGCRVAKSVGFVCGRATLEPNEVLMQYVIEL